MDALFDAYGLTHIGLNRENDEDAFLSEPEIGVFGIADGIGGYPKGEVASRLALRTIADECGGRPREAALRRAFLAANVTLILKSLREIPFGRMGCAATVAWVDCENGHALVGHVGDTRAYLHGQNGGGILPLTVDHNEADQRLPEAERMMSPDRCILTRSIGTHDRGLSDPEPWVDITEFEFRPGDTLLLVTDGITGFLPFREFAMLAAIPTQSAQSLAELIVEQTFSAQRRKFHGDNIGVLVARRIS